MAEKYIAILWGREDDANSISPLESTNGDYTFWTERVGVDTPEFRKVLKDDTGLTVSIFKDDASWAEGQPSLENAYIIRAWSDDKVRDIVANLMHCAPENVTLKRVA